MNFHPSLTLPVVKEEGSPLFDCQIASCGKHMNSTTFGEKPMKSLVSAIERFFCDEEGATAVEYGVMVALVAAAIVVIVYFVGLQVKEAFNKVCTSVANLVGGACS